MIRCVHHVPGRARFKLEVLRHDQALADRIKSEVGALPGVSVVEINRHAASVIVYYCTERGEIDGIMKFICAHCPNASREHCGMASTPPAIKLQSHPAGSSRANSTVSRALGEAVGRAVMATFINRTVERGLSSLLAGMRL